MMHKHATLGEYAKCEKCGLLLNVAKRKDKKQFRPVTIKILNAEYQISYEAKPSDVDIFKRESAWGQIDFWTRTIRIYDNKTTTADILHTLLHEILHGLVEALHIELLSKSDTQKENEKIIDLLAVGLTSVFLDNKLLRES